MKPKRLLAVLLTLILTCSFVTSASAASCGEYVDWTWKNGTSSLSVQLFPSAYDFYDNIYAVYQSWNDISSEVSIDGFTYYADGTNQNKDIQIVGAALTGTTLANTGIYSKNTLGVYTQQGFWSYTGKVSKAVITIDTSGRFGGQTDTWERKTIIHELGHALALDHPSCTNRAIMHKTSSSYVYHIGKIRFIVTPVYKETGELMRDILLKLMLADLEPV